MCTKWYTQTFPPIFFGLFTIFHCNFPKIVVPPSNRNANYLVHLKGQWLPKNGENCIKIYP